MSTNRRTFLKQLSLAGLGLTGASKWISENRGPFGLSHHQRFNMHGYAAPALETVANRSNSVQVPDFTAGVMENQ